jgi:Ca2+/H+ antiporter
MSLKPSLNWLLALAPVAVVLELQHAAAPLVFFAAALAIVPIAALLVHATEQLAVRTGDAVGGLLNATFGNAPELIIAFVALKAGLMQMVLASIMAPSSPACCSPLAAFFLGGLKKHDQDTTPALPGCTASCSSPSSCSLPPAPSRTCLAPKLPPCAPIRSMSVSPCCCSRSTCCTWSSC